MVCRMGDGISQVSEWRREHQCVVGRMRDSHIAGGRQCDLRCAKYQRDEHEAEGRADKDDRARRWKEAAIVLHFQRLPSTISVPLRASNPFLKALRLFLSIRNFNRSRHKQPCHFRIMATIRA